MLNLTVGPSPIGVKFGFSPLKVWAFIFIFIGSNFFINSLHCGVQFSSWEHEVHSKLRITLGVWATRPHSSPEYKSSPWLHPGISSFNISLSFVFSMQFRWYQDHVEEFFFLKLFPQSVKTQVNQIGPIRPIGQDNPTGQTMGCSIVVMYIIFNDCK